MMFFVFFFFASFSICFKPIIYLHGLSGSNHDFDSGTRWIHEQRPDTPIFQLDFFNNLLSFEQMPMQLPVVIEKFTQVKSENNLTDIILIAHSQGTLLARGLIEQTDDHGIDTFISIAGIHQGQFGIPAINLTLPQWLEFMRDLTLKECSELVYSDLFQTFVSFANFWKDPYQLDRYIENARYLPFINNEVDHPDRERYKNNFLKLNKLFLFGSEGDEIIKPWQSCCFEFYEENSSTDIVEMRNTETYKNDWIGLKTLDEQGKVTVVNTVKGVHHADWITKKDIFMKVVFPYLD